MRDLQITRKLFRSILVLGAMWLNFSCGGGGGGISTLPLSDEFKEAPITSNPKVDVLWVIDPSRSMFAEIQAVQNNLESFASAFYDKKQDFRIGVITSAAWSSLSEGESGKDFLNNNPFKSLHTGDCVGNAGTEDFLSPTSAPSSAQFKLLFEDYVDVYGVKLSTESCGLEGPPFAVAPNDFPSIDTANGYGADNIFSDAIGRTKIERGQFLPYVTDERPLQSLQAYLNPNALSGGSNAYADLSTDTGAASFLREDAFLAVIFVTDEMDASRDDLEPDAMGTASHTATQYLAYLDELKESRDNYKVFSIISDPDGAGSANLLKEVAESTGTIPIDIESNFGSQLADISTNIIAEASFFPLSCAAIESTIQITYEDGGNVVSVPDAPVGFTYDSTRIGVVFTPEHAPPGGASVSVNFTPAQLGCSGTGSLRAIALTQNEILEDAATGTVVGTAEVTHPDPDLTYQYSINPASTEFAIDANTGVVTTAASFDYESQRVYPITIEAFDGTDTQSETFNILISDVSDAAATPVADSYSIDESQVTNGGTFVDRLYINDTGLDDVDTHTYTVTDTAQCPGVGLDSGAAPGDVEFNIVNAEVGEFSFQVLTNLNLDPGDSRIIVYNYGLIDSGTSTCQTSSVSIEVTGENQAPETRSSGGVPNPLTSIDSSGSVGSVVTEAFDDNKIKDLNSGTTLNSSNPLDSTATPEGYHGIVLELEAIGGTTFREVSQLVLGAESGYDFGNTVVQVIYDDGSSESVLTREVLPIDQGNSVTINFSDLVLGNKIKILRPESAVNSNSEDFVNLTSVQITSRTVELTCVDVMDHIMDQDVPDLPAPMGSDALSFFVADSVAEGPAPAWALVVNNSTPSDTRDDKLCVRPPNGTDIDLSLIARDDSGATHVEVFNVQRDDGGAAPPNNPPIALLQVSDTQRGGITYKRFGGRDGNNQSAPFTDYSYAEPGASCTTGSGSGTSDVDHSELDEFIQSEYFPDLGLSADNDSAVTSGAEFYDGWETQCYTFYEEKFTQGGSCQPSSSPGVLRPCIITGTNVYGETYTGFFSPSQTGIYRFRSQSVDNTVRLLMAPNEYVSDMIPVITGALDNSTVRQVARSGDFGPADTASWACGGQLGNMLGSSGSAPYSYDYSIFGPSPKCDSEFYPGNFGGGHDTARFYHDLDNPASSAYNPDYNSSTDLSNGWVFLKKGNVYATQIRFAEGGGAKQFSFSFDYKPLGQSGFNNNWRSLDAVSLIPNEGSSAYPGTFIPNPGGSVDFNVSSLFYDTELDVLEYSARLVNPDGTSSAQLISDIGLTLNASTGQLTGTLNNPDDLKIVFGARDISGSNQVVEYLPIKFAE